MIKLTSAQDAIKQAIEGGWDSNTLRSLQVFARTKSKVMPVEVFLSDPSFWQALGKARGWEKDFTRYGFNKKHYEAWFAFAIRYFETRLSRGNENKFWKSLP